MIRKRYLLRERKPVKDIPVYIYTPGKRKKRAQTVDDNPFGTKRNLNRSLATSLVYFEPEDIENLNKSVADITEETELVDLNRSFDINKSVHEALNEPENLTQVVNVSLKSSVLIQNENENEKYNEIFDSIPPLIDIYDEMMI